MKSVTYHSRIARRLIVSIVLFSSLITLIATAIQLYGEYKRDIKSIDTRLQQIQASYLQGITEAVWVADRTQLQIMLDGIGEIRDIIYAEVRVDGKVYQRSGEPTDKNIITLKLDLNYHYRNKVHKIGELTVLASLSGIYQRLINRVWVILVSNGIKTFFVALFIYFLFNKLVTRHLDRIAAYASSHDIRNADLQLSLERRPNPPDKRDELDELVDAFNQMHDNLRASFEALVESEQQVRLLLDSTAEAIYGIDLQGRCIFVNPACVRMLGYESADELVGHDIHEMIHQHEAEGETRLEEQWLVQILAQQGQAGHSDEDVYRRKDGSSFPVEWWAHPIIRHGESAGAMVTFFDISQRKQNEEELHQYREELEKLVQQRTDALESFSYSVSHDLRAPLRSIHGFSQALLEDYSDKLDGEGAYFLNRIMTNTLRMAQLIDDLLHLSQLSRRDIQFEKFDMSAMAEGIIRYLKKQSPEREVEIHIQAEMTACGDPGLLRILLENLLGNAWKYTAYEKVARIEFGCHVVDGEEVFYLRDNGVGFEMQYVDKLFGAFQRLHGEEFEGTGIGLATVARIVERHGGRIWAESVKGEGATFSFTLA